MSSAFPMIQNLSQNLPRQLPEEVIQSLIDTPHVRIERIISHGHSSPPGFWYDQTRAEFVVVLSGAAHIKIEAHPELLVLQPGDCLTLLPHQRHRVEWTDPEQPTVWLAVHFDQPQSPLPT